MNFGGPSAHEDSLEGTAIHAVTREPLSNVHVRLVGLSSAYGEISGTVQDDKGLAAGARVVIRDTRSSVGNTRDVASGADGTYSIKSVAPGTYQLLVVDESEAHTITTEPGSDDFDDLAEMVKVRAKETLKRDLKVRAVGVR